jgi:uncharacterized protein
LSYKTSYRYEEKLSQFFTLEKERVGLLLDEYLAYGGYPRVVLAETEQEKYRIIEEIYQSYILKDIKALLNVQKTEAFSNLVKMLAVQSGKLINYANLSSNLDLTFTTIKAYLWYLQQTFVIQKVSPYYKNKQKELTKAPLYYFTDVGFRNFAAHSISTQTRTHRS